VASYFGGGKSGPASGFQRNGSNDPIYFGSQTGSRTAAGANVEVDYLPWLNVKLGLQYTAYANSKVRHPILRRLRAQNASDNNLSSAISGSRY